jgi:AMP-polyphosphate phosphotransferase
VKGKIGIFDRSWYSRAIIECLGKEKSEEKMEKCLGKIDYFERQLTEDNYLYNKNFSTYKRKRIQRKF